MATSEMGREDRIVVQLVEARRGGCPGRARANKCVQCCSAPRWWLMLLACGAQDRDVSDQGSHSVASAQLRVATLEQRHEETNPISRFPPPWFRTSGRQLCQRSTVSRPLLLSMVPRDAPACSHDTSLTDRHALRSHTDTYGHALLGQHRRFARGRIEDNSHAASLHH